jgi:isoleucyl-tRNA synthetase
MPRPLRTIAAMAQPFTRLPSVPELSALEQEILEFWQRERVFDRLREQNAEGPRFSFFDGPVTANKTMGVHTAWGRTLKDVFLRYKALRGYHQRYQNGWDCQGLWIEVGVEKSLGMNSKKEIEEYGLDKFAAKCRDIVAWSSGELRRASERLGQWMDWERDYYTFSDTNIEYIWRFLKVVHDRGWLVLGHRSAPWCPRCGTSLSQHELSQAGVRQDREDSALTVRLPLLDHPGEALLIWTTTPWTLPANVAAAVQPGITYGRLPSGDWVSVESLPEDVEFGAIRKGRELVGLRYEGPFDALGPGAAVEHRVIAWEDVALDTGTGVVHIAPGAGPEDYVLSTVHDLPVLTPVDESGRFYSDYGWLAGMSADEAREPIIDDLDKRGLLVEAGTIVHDYPHCWRCDTPLIFRVADDWLIAVDGVRQQLLDENAKVEWTPVQYGKRMDDWLRNMEDWNISRRRYYGLPLPFYPCTCGHLNVIGSRAELEARAVSGLDQLKELHRPWIDEVVVTCEHCGQHLRRIPEVGDVWLDAGIVPFSTLGWQNDAFVPEGYATGAAKGLTKADLPDHAYWEQWFPADWVTEMREQTRLWFYSLLFMSVVLTGRSPFRKVLTYEKLLDAEGREMHGSWGNLIAADEAFDRMGADVMRWLYCRQPPTQNIRFGYGPADEVKRRLLTLWNSARFFADYAAIEGFRPRYEDLTERVTGVELKPLDAWLLARTNQLIADAEAAYEAYLTVDAIDAFEAFLEDLSNWYIRRSRRRFYSFDEAAFRTLWTALVQTLRVVAPVLPFLGERLWQALVTGACPDAPASVHLAGWPTRCERPGDEELLAEIAAVRDVVQLGRRARGEANLKLRQPLRRMFVRGASAAAGHAEEIAEELRVKEVGFDQGPVARVQLLPNLRLLGPRLGSKLPQVRAALQHSDVDQLDDGRLRAAGEVLEPDEVIRGERVALEGWAIAEDDGISVAFDTTLDDELRREGRVLDLVHALNGMRKSAGLELTDRIVVTLPRSEEDLLAYRDRIANEVLAREITVDDVAKPKIAKA